jgi:hypothetical protein
MLGSLISLRNMGLPVRKDELVLQASSFSAAVCTALHRHSELQAIRTAATHSPTEVQMPRHSHGLPRAAPRNAIIADIFPQKHQVEGGSGCVEPFSD